MIPVRVWVVEDDTLYRRSLSCVLSEAEEVSDCRTFPSCMKMFEALKRSKLPEIVLMDLGLPKMSGVEGIKKLAATYPDVAVIVLTVFSDKGKVFDALDAGASGYLLKSASDAEIIKGLQEVFMGGSTLSPSIARIVLKDIRNPIPSSDYKLAVREIEVLEGLADGVSMRRIADKMEISESTVATYVRRIYSKLRVQTQSGAVAKAFRTGILK